MARTPKLGTNNLLYLDLTTAVTTPGVDVPFIGYFKPVVCLTSNTWTGTTAKIDTSSKCIALFETSIPGRMGFTFGGTGQAVALTSPNTNTDYNYIKLWQLWKAQTQFWIAAFDTDYASVRLAVAYITNMTEPNPDNAVSTFDITFQGTGEIWDQTATT